MGMNECYFRLQLTKSLRLAIIEELNGRGFPAKIVNDELVVGEAEKHIKFSEDTIQDAVGLIIQSTERFRSEHEDIRS
ncbi:MAG: hypothetical protein UW05_C0010G0024 [Candidatus Giovannonibacteria bacterium GW2011_GWC2_43_8]|nr:MAG: hypothetical protein UW05_C0010G0024 [Candidatus Giovannonibacteria bacterium GW2011_GWC2_43_8]